MYHENYGFKSGINEVIKADLDDNVVHAFQYVNDPKTWCDIASNDGYLLSCVPTDIYRVGVDPVKFLCEQAKEHADLIINDYFSLEAIYKAKAIFVPDVITSVSVFYDMPNPSKFVEDVASILAPKGVWVIQQNYLLTTMQILAVDNFCHEHLEYYTLYSLEKLLNRFGLEVNEVKLSTINGGSIRTIVSHKGTFEIDPSVQLQRDREADFGVTSLTTYQEFAENIGENLNQLYRLVKDLHDEGKSIGILAASTRGSTIWQSANIQEFIECAIERNPAKVGKMFSSIGVPIISEEDAQKIHLDYAIIGPWFFGEAFAERYKDWPVKLIMPLPEVKIL